MSAAMEALHIQHFKCFQKARIPVSPLTLLTGMNGAGKSTTIQSLLLMRAAELAEREVALNGPFGLALGEASDVIHRAADFEEGVFLGFERRGVTANWHLGAGSNMDERRPALEIRARATERVAAGGRAFVYLCAERLGPRDALAPASVSDHEVTVGVQGENTAQVLALLDRSQVEPARRHPAAPKNASTLLIHTEHWASSIIRPMQIEPSWVPGVAVTTLRFRDPGATEWTRPFNTGFGVSYALPLIVAALTVPVGGLLIVENPEAHLHPAGQSAMGHLLARVAADGVQVFVETHSDHVLNGVRRAIGVDRLLSAENARCIFYNGTQGADGESWTSLGFTETGGVERWPGLFFDQYQLDVAQLAKARRPKKPGQTEEKA